MKTEIEIFCENLVFLRKERGFSQKEMAKLLGIGVKSLRKLEKGTLPPRMNINFFFSIWAKFGVSPSEQLISLLNENKSIC